MFDKIIKRKFNDTFIEYGIINGNNTILLIKTGSEGTIYGYNNKYLELAKYVSSKYGFTVIVSSNPRTGINSNQLADAIEFIDEYFKDKYEIYYMGISNGGLIGAWYGNNYSFKRMLLINPPLMINYHKTKEEYSAKALKFANTIDRENCKSVVDRNGTTYKYNPKTNVLVEVIKDGYIVSYRHYGSTFWYEPKKGVKEWIK